MPTARRALAGAAGGVLGDGEAGVDADAGEEVAAHGGAGALGGDQDHVHVLRGRSTPVSWR